MRSQSKARPNRLGSRRTGPRRSVFFSRLARAIFFSNLIGLIILISGSLAMDRFTQGLINAKVQDLRSQTSLVTSVMGDTASGIGAAAELDVINAKSVLRRMDLPGQWRIRLYDKTGLLIADSARLDDEISISALDPIVTEQVEPPKWQVNFRLAEDWVNDHLHNLPWRVKHRDRLRWDEQADVKTALGGAIVAGEKYDSDDELIVAVTAPVKRVQAVLGVVTLESSDVDNIIRGERQALTPIIGLAFVVAMMSSLLLSLFVAMPIRRLARAAEMVTRSSENRDAIPDLSRRRDEIGDLSVVMRDMTKGLYDRIDDVANFAADVAHEIKNPLTSLRSASDTLSVAKTAEQREKLIDIIQNDVERMDRLISDISKASKVDADLARESVQILDVNQVLINLTEFYDQTRTPDGARVEYTPAFPRGEDVFIRAFETPFAQVLRNLIDNALTFSPPDGSVRLKGVLIGEGEAERVILTVEDDGPGIPEENLETVFERFYTQRPKGAEFGSHSGLGLAICRQIVTAHKGQIHAENRKQGDKVVGAMFVINLPRQTRGGAPAPKKSKRKREGTTRRP